MEEIEGDKYIQVDEKTIILQANSPEISGLSEVPKYTPTGKVSLAKTRVYTQRYRKDWELMSDFRGWLTSVPHKPTRAYCKFCKKDLHAHRLSLLKHMCTMKHQRSTQMFHNNLKAKKSGIDKKLMGIDDDEFTEIDESAGELMEEEEDIEYAYEEVEPEDETNFPEHKYARDISEEEVNHKIQLKMIKTENHESKRDALAEAMAHVHGEVSEESVEDDQYEMDLVSETVEFSEEITETLSEDQHLSLVSLESTDADPQNSGDQTSDPEPMSQEIEFVDTTSVASRPPPLKKASIPISNTITTTSKNNKTYVTLPTKKMIPGAQYIFNKIKGTPSFMNEKKAQFITISSKNLGNQSSQEEASTSQGKKMMRVNKPMTSIMIKKPTISTHVLDMNKGLPIGGLSVSLYQLLEGRWTFVNECNTSTAGKCSDLIEIEKNILTKGRYKLHFDVDKYFSLRKIETLYPFIEIVFDVKNPVISYHIPILLSPFGYTTYRGMDS